MATGAQISARHDGAMDSRWYDPKVHLHKGNFEEVDEKEAPRLPLPNVGCPKRLGQPRRAKGKIELSERGGGAQVVDHRGRSRQRGGDDHPTGEGSVCVSAGRSLTAAGPLSV